MTPITKRRTLSALFAALLLCVFGITIGRPIPNLLGIRPIDTPLSFVWHGGSSIRESVPIPNPSITERDNNRKSRFVYLLHFCVDINHFDFKTIIFHGQALHRGIERAHHLFGGYKVNRMYLMTTQAVYHFGRSSTLVSGHHSTESRKTRVLFNLDNQPRAFGFNHDFSVQQSGFGTILSGNSRFVGYGDRFIQFVGLSFNRPERAPQKIYLKTANTDQQQTEDPITPIGPISPGCRYRHGGKFADDYGMICIFISVFAAIGLIPYGLIRRDCGHRYSGWGLCVLGVCLAILACVSGAIGCLPWNWWGCLRDGQQHSQNYDGHSANYTTALVFETAQIPVYLMSFSQPLLFPSNQMTLRGML